MGNRKVKKVQNDWFLPHFITKTDYLKQAKHRVVFGYREGATWVSWAPRCVAAAAAAALPTALAVKTRVTKGRMECLEIPTGPAQTDSDYSQKNLHPENADVKEMNIFKLLFRLFLFLQKQQTSQIILPLIL